MKTTLISILLILLTYYSYTVKGCDVKRKLRYGGAASAVHATLLGSNVFLYGMNNNLLTTTEYANTCCATHTLRVHAGDLISHMRAGKLNGMTYQVLNQYTGDRVCKRFTKNSFTVIPCENACKYSVATATADENEDEDENDQNEQNKILSKNAGVAVHPEGENKTKLELDSLDSYKDNKRDRAEDHDEDKDDYDEEEDDEKDAKKAVAIKVSEKNTLGCQTKKSLRYGGAISAVHATLLQSNVFLYGMNNNLITTTEYANTCCATHIIRVKAHDLLDLRHAGKLNGMRYQVLTQYTGDRRCKKFKQNGYTTINCADACK